MKKTAGHHFLVTIEFSVSCSQNKTPPGADGKYRLHRVVFFDLEVNWRKVLFDKGAKAEEQIREISGAMRAPVVFPVQCGTVEQISSAIFSYFNI